MSNFQKNHFECLDILRGIAALLVVFTHGVSRNLWSGPATGSTGVAIFFCLSGFLMGYLYSLRKISYLEVYKYFISRFSRIAPAYLIVITASYIIYNFIDSNFIYAINNHNLARHLLFSGNVSVFWSIPPEVQFYAYFIFIWFALDRIKRFFLLPLLLLVILSLAFIYMRDSFPGTTLPSKLHLFLFGCFAGTIRNHHIFNKLYIDSNLQMFSMIIMVLYGIYLENISNTSSLYGYFHYPLICSMIIIFLSVNNKKGGEYVKAKGFFVLLGKISFSLYLIHEIVLYIMEKLNFGFNSFLNLSIGFAASVLVTYCFYSLIENPLNKKIKLFLDKQAN
jgi:peptidoglycan/LPS O-acetylase OafA/YrhL